MSADDHQSLEPSPEEVAMLHAPADARGACQPSSPTSTLRRHALPVARPPATESPSPAVSRLALLRQRPDGVEAVLTVAALLAELPSRGRIDMGACLHDLCRDLDQAFGRPGGPSLSCSAAAHLLPMGQAITLGLVADLLVSDAYIYGFSPAEGGRIAVSLTGREAVFELNIDDSGLNGRATARRRDDGVTIASLLVSQLGGGLETPTVVGGRSCIVTLPRQTNRLSS
jgi:two-component sensor histidine kinase